MSFRETAGCEAVDYHRRQQCSAGSLPFGLRAADFLRRSYVGSRQYQPLHHRSTKSRGLACCGLHRRTAGDGSPRDHLDRLSGEPIGDAIEPLEGLEMSATVFLNSILFSFYPFMAILLVFLVITTGREFGPMLSAERRARSTGVTAPRLNPPWVKMTSCIGHEAGCAPRAINALLPVAVMIVGILVGFICR